jgi:hypothetical protein
LFNAIIESLNLRELELTGRKYTWTNYAEVPTYEKLDRILVTIEWEQKFPLASVQALTHGISDHTPLLLDAGEPSHRGNARNFKFELGWQTRDGFFELVKVVWEYENRGRSPLEQWQNKIRRLRRFLRGWARNLVLQNKTKKSNLLDMIDVLNKKVETSLLSLQEMELRHHLKGQLTKLLREEIYWLQRSKATKLLQEDDNTKYFYLVANGRHRKTKNVQLEQEEETIVGDENLKNYIPEYYKGLFGLHTQNSFSMNETLRYDIPQVSEEENEVLTAPFSEEEIKTTVFDMEHNKPPGPDGFPAEFY